MGEQKQWCVQKAVKIKPNAIVIFLFYLFHTVHYSTEVLLKTIAVNISPGADYVVIATEYIPREQD